MGFLTPDWRRPGRTARLMLPLAWLCTATTLAQTSGLALPEEQVKAAFVYNFIKFVDWSGKQESGSAPLLIGVAGDDSLAEALERAVQERTVGGRPLIVQRLSRLHELQTCNIAFLGWPDQERVKRALKFLRGSSVLTIGQLPGFVPLGGIIGLAQENSRMRFDINLQAAESAGLRISAKLLHLARSVVRDVR